MGKRREEESKAGMNRRARIVTQPCLFGEGRIADRFADIVAPFAAIEKENLWNWRIAEREVRASEFRSS
jgi:hypothetical protein